MRLVAVVGARPNFMKMAPVIREARECPGIHVTFVNTGQHYDDEMSAVFLQDLELPQPDVSLGVGSGTHAQQTARIMVGFEEFLTGEKADMVIVGGDVNSTLACSLVASKLRVPLAHVEAGLRSFDRTMPEEINRVVTDALSDLLFTTCEDANANLEREGIAAEKIFFVGNTMIDSLMAYLNRALESGIHERIGVEEGSYALLTMHRPSNVDTPQVLEGVLDALDWIQSRIELLFPVHPRTRERIREFGFSRKLSGMRNLRLLPPLGYLEFLALMARSRLVLTDSGGIQEETTILGIPCVTLRWNTERPVTVREGTNVVVGNDPSRIISAVGKILQGSGRPEGRAVADDQGAFRQPGSERCGPSRKEMAGARPKLWDGKAAERIVEVVKSYRHVRGGHRGNEETTLE